MKYCFIYEDGRVEYHEVEGRPPKVIVADPMPPLTAQCLTEPGAYRVSLQKPWKERTFRRVVKPSRCVMYLEDE